MSFPKNCVCVILVDRLNELNDVAEQMYLPLQPHLKIRKLIGNSSKKQKVFLRVDSLPEFVKIYLKELNCCSLVYALGNEKVLCELDERKIMQCCKKRNVIKVERLIKKLEPDWALNHYNYKLLLLCSLLLCNCISETKFKHQVRLI